MKFFYYFPYIYMGIIIEAFISACVWPWGFTESSPMNKKVFYSLHKKIFEPLALR